MKPVAFPGSHDILGGETGANPLPAVYGSDGGSINIISKWRLTWRDVLRVVVTRTVWLSVRGKATPPVYVGTEYPFTDGAKR